MSVHWNGRGTLLAAVCKVNRFFILTYQGNVVYDVQVPLPMAGGITAFTWAHGDRIVLATSGKRLAIGRVVPDVPTLSVLVTYSVWQFMNKSGRLVDMLPVPSREKSVIRQLDHHLIRCRVPSEDELLEKVYEPTEWRWYCTIRPVPRRPNTYVLCMEHMAGLVPLLIGKQTNRLIPQFQVSLYNSASLLETSDNGNSAQVEDVGAFARPSTQRNSVWRRSKRQLRAMMSRHMKRPLSRTNEKLVQVSSNVWCTRFKMTSLIINFHPNLLAQVFYKTSVLHLQPRQMKVRLAVLATPGASGLRESAKCNAQKAGFQLSNSNTCSNRSSIRSGVAIAPSDRDNLIRTHNTANDEEPLIDEIAEEPLSAEEKLLFQSVVSEFNDLKTAVERHIARMKYFASDLEKSSQKLEPFGTTTTSSSSVLRGLPPRISTNSQDECVVNAKIRHRHEVAGTGQSTSNAGWPEQFDDIEGTRFPYATVDDHFFVPYIISKFCFKVFFLQYIDEDDAVVMRNSSERTPLIDYIKTAEPSRKGLRQLNDITSVLDKLAKMANDLTSARCVVRQLSDETATTSRDSEEFHATVLSLRSQLKDIARKVSQIEKKISYGKCRYALETTFSFSILPVTSIAITGDELLDEVCGDLQRRIQHIKAVLGEQPPVDESRYCVPRFLMYNKAPFWNEASQVYQLDFGGRVTQESAKNFQIELNGKQVMQFGRIENGAYTLDFRYPFTAVQAFAVALASITQRLK
ncbi:unnamed protein product [Gongylonema pulchrum]|uniref:Tubby C-terminal domain-containing protein n=1 Tax=Gongylonema pulchrum TaxID=637853 RepID=A0A3P6NTF3_9BILA|nr:unnamed protein product [Gongylonema pulchrum]